jgi:hypothetical protein
MAAEVADILYDEYIYSKVFLKVDMSYLEEIGGNYCLF